MAVIYHSQRNDILLSGGSTNVSVSYTCSSKDNTVLLLIVRVDGGAVSSVSYGGRDFTVLATNGSVTLYAMKAPPQGANTLSINCDTYVSILTSMADFSGVDQTNTFTPTVSSTGTGTAWSTGLVTLAPGGMGYGGFYTNYTVSSGTITASGSTSLLAASRNSLNGKRFGHGIISQPTTLNWSFSGSSVAWWTIGVGLTPYEELQNRPRPSRIYRDRVSQPQGVSTIDWGSPLSVGLISAYNPAVGPREVIFGTPVSSQFASPLSNYVGVEGIGRTGAVSSFLYDNFVLPVATGDSITVLVVAQHTLNRGGNAWFVSRDNTNTSANRHWRLDANSSNFPSFTGFDTTGASVTATHTISTNPAISNVLVGRINGTSVDVWMDGIQGGSATIGGTSNVAVTANATNDPLAVGGRFPNFSNASAGGPVYLVLHWNRALSDAEIASISTSPWQLFAPRPLWVNTSEAAASPVANKPLTLDTNPRKTPIHPSIGVQLNSRFTTTSVLVPRGNVMADTNTNKVFATFGVSGTIITTLFGTALSWGGEAHYGFPPASVLIVRLGRVTPDSSILSNHSIGGGQYTHRVIIGSTGYYEIYNQGAILQNTSTVLAKEGDVLALSLLPGNTAKLYTPYETLNSGTETGTGNSFRIGRTELTKTAAKSFLYAAVFNKLTEEEIKHLISNPNELFAPTNKFIQTAYSPKAPWSVAKSRVLGTSTGAPATVATASRVQVPWQRQPQVATDLQFESIASNLLIALNPSAGLRNMVVRGPKISVTGTPTVGASSSGVAISNFSAANYLSFINPISVDGPGTVFLLMQNTSTVDQGGHTLTSGTGTGAQEHYPFSNNLYIATLGDTRWVNGTSVPGGVSQLLKPYSVAVTKKAGITGSLWPVFRLYVNGINISTSTSGTTGANPGVTFTLGLNTQSGTAYGGRLMLFAMWERELSAAEINLLHINPWQLFAPRTAQIPVGVSL